MGPVIQGRKIAIVGASGQLGKPTIKALIGLGVHTITAIQRSEATSTFPTSYPLSLAPIPLPASF
jgi:uncharacterized protein YbjT (DUF2867 family)